MVKRCGFWLVVTLVACGPTEQTRRDAGADGAIPSDGAVPSDAGEGADGTLPTDGTSGADAVTVEPCQAIPGASYGTLSTVGDVSDRPAAQHADLNLKLRGWEITGGTLGMVDYGGNTDLSAPKLNTLFEPDRVPSFVTNYQVYSWDWSTNSRGGLITDWDVTLTGFGTTVGEIVQLPMSGYTIGAGYQARVLYADEDSITLKYTAEDNVVYGYTIHLVGLCVEPSLRALYDACDAAGRAELPALQGNQAVGRVRGAEIKAAIRDTGAFMDPRSEKDWW